ncbi:MAG: DUF308 domain-containing protein [Nautiliaceae bacterium]|jgi:uncharacterized membrane protein HdeD (DUF308 family)
MFISNRIDKEKLKEFSTLSIISGLLMIGAGILSIANPLAGSLTFILFLGAMFITGSIIQAVITFKAHQKSLGAWFKVFLLFVTGILLLLWPLSGIAAFSLLLAAYFFMDAFASFGVALDLRPLKGWGMAAVNGILSLILGIIIVLNWPINSAYILGVIIGVSFLMDGIVLVYLGFLSKKGAHD